MSRQRRILISAPAAAFLLALSGFASLVYETAWTRILESLLGHTVPTTATVVAGFLGGLALGSLGAARWASRIQRPLAVYAALEAGAALWAVVLPTLAGLADWGGRALLGPAWAAPGPGDLFRWASGFLVVVIPAVAMGAVFPVVVEAASRDDASRPLPGLVGLLYASNTAGAACGTAVAGFLLVRHLGLQGTLRTGALVGLAAAALAAARSRTGASFAPRQATPTVSTTGVGRPGWLLLTILAAAGFASLALEVLWLRLFAFPLGSNILSFSTVVAALVAATALGSWLGALLHRRVEGPGGLALVEMGLALTALCTTLVFAHFSQALSLLGAVLPGEALLESLPGRMVLVALLVGVPGLFMGAVLPVAMGWDPEDLGAGSPGATSGWLYGALTAGNVAGALAAGYLLIPSMGITGSLFLSSGVASAAAIAAAWRARRVRGVLLTTAATAGAFLLAWSLLGGSVTAGVAAVRDPHARLLAFLEGVQGTVTVSEVPPLPVMMDNRPPEFIGPVGWGYRLIAVDAVQVAGTAPDLRTTQELQAHIPLLLHPHPDRVLQIGYGSGETTREARLHQPGELTVVELNRDVVRMTRRWFPALAGRGTANLFTDARLAVRTSSRRWDVILNDSTYPGMVGSSQLYSSEHFQACRNHLRPGGIVSTWLPVDLPPETFKTVLATFSSVFPECSFWLAPNCLNKHGVLVGTTGDDGLMEPRPEEQWPEGVAESLHLLGFSGRPSLAAIRILDSVAIARLAEGAPVNSDDRPVLEYPVKGIRISGNDYWKATLQTILAEGRSRNLSPGILLLLEGQVSFLSGDPEGALELYRRARSLLPGSPWPGNLIQGIEVQRAQREFALAMEALQADRRSQALSHLERCIGHAPEAVACREELGRLLLWSGRPAEALGHLEMVRDLGTNPTRVLLEIGDALRLTGRPARAEKAYRHYLESHAPTFGVLAALAEAVATQGRLEEAERLALRAVTLDPHRREGADLLASIRAARGSRAPDSR